VLHPFVKGLRIGVTGSAKRCTCIHLTTFALIATIEKLGGKPVAERAMADCAKALRADTLKNQTDVLGLAARLELGAANAYLGVIPAFTDSALSKVSARLAADETMHWTALAGALGKSLPMAALGFGA
jgi:hypothetical protein